MPHFYQKTDETPSAWGSVALGLLVALLIFLLVPFTQMMESPSKALVVDEAIEISVAPPVPALPAAESPPAAQAAQAVPQLERPLPMPTLKPMDLVLAPRIGADLSGALDVDLHFQTESAEQLIELFGFDDLDQVPFITRPGRFNYRSVLQRRGVEGYVELLIVIDPTGRVEVREVLGYSHRELVAAAKAGAAATRFSPPLRNGQPVQAQYSWRIEFRMDR
jgi:TonB family protein